MHVFITGFMAAGKSTVGKKLASRLKLNFIDLDEEIVKRSGHTISEWFEQKGEVDFREYESNTLKTFSDSDSCVIGVGGGTPCHHQNMNWMNDNGITVYLKMHPGSIYHRLAKAGKDRPLLKGKTDVELMEFIKITMDEREPDYLRSKIVIKGESLDLDLLEEKVRTILFTLS